MADSAMREQITDLIKGWSLTDPNPDAYRQALSRMSTAGPMLAVAAQAQFRPEPRRMFEMALEVDKMGDGVERAVSELIEEGHLRYVVNALHEADAPTVTEALWHLLGSEEALGEILDADPIDAEVLDMILLRIGSRATEQMLDKLAESEVQQTRRVLIDRLVRFGPEVGPAVVRRLDDDRWFVQRNMLSILAQLPQIPPEFDAAGMLNHEDQRVRRVAVEVALQVHATRERAMAAALVDKEDRIVRMGLSAAAEWCPDTVLPLVIRTAIDGTSEEQRSIAVRVLARSKRKPAVEALLRLAAPRRSFLRWKLPPKSKVFLAALEALQAHKSDSRVKRVLDVVARSRDPEVAAAARGGGEGEK
jgi:hypothetical protein